MYRRPYFLLLISLSPLSGQAGDEPGQGSAKKQGERIVAHIGQLHVFDLTRFKPERVQ